MSKTVILSAARTPVGKFGGSLKDVKATELGGIAIKAALERANVAASDVEEVIFGTVIQGGQGKFHRAKLRGLLESLGKCRRKQ